MQEKMAQAERDEANQEIERANKAHARSERSRSRGKGEASPMNTNPSQVSMNQIKAAPQQAAAPNNSLEDSQLIAKKRAEAKAAIMAEESADNRQEQAHMDNISKIAKQHSAGKPRQNKLPPGGAVSAAAAA